MPNEKNEYKVFVLHPIVEEFLKTPLSDYGGHEDTTIAQALKPRATEKAKELLNSIVKDLSAAKTWAQFTDERQATIEAFQKARKELWQNMTSYYEAVAELRHKAVLSGYHKADVFSPCSQLIKRIDALDAADNALAQTAEAWAEEPLEMSDGLRGRISPAGGFALAADAVAARALREDTISDKVTRGVNRFVLEHHEALGMSPYNLTKPSGREAAQNALKQARLRFRRSPSTRIFDGYRKAFPALPARP